MRIRGISLFAILILAGVALPREGVSRPRSGVVVSPNFTLTIELRDRTGKPIDARVSVLDPYSGYCHPPADTTEPVYYSWSGHQYFYATERVEVIVPEGMVRVLVAKGPEYTVFDKLIEMTNDRIYRVQLQRLVDPTVYGWFSGDTHVHEAHGGLGAVYTIDNEQMARVARAEDLNLTCVLSNGPYFNGGIDPASDARHLVHYGLEYRSAVYGHMGVLGLQTLLPAGCCVPGEPAYPLNRAVCEAAHAQGATVVSSHPLPMDPLYFMNATLPWPYSGLARELPADLLAGEVDAIDVFSYSNYAEQAMRDFWFDLLDLGLRIPLSVGTDASVNRIYDPPAGGYRVYVRPEAPFTLSSWLEGLRRGHSFATNGPLMLDFSLDAKGPGGVLRLPADELIVARGHLLLYSREPVESLEIYSNGQKIATFALPGTAGWLYYDFDLPLKAEPGWVVARVTGQTTAASTVGRPGQAITSPIYLEVLDRPFEAKAAAVSRFDGWIRDLQALVLQRDGWIDVGQMLEAWGDLEAMRLLLYGRPGIAVDPPVPEVPPEPNTIAVTRTERGSAHLFRADGVGEAVLEVFDVTGRCVSVSAAQSLPAEFTWDPSGGTGSRAAGLYFARVRGESRSSPVQRVLVLR